MFRSIKSGFLIFGMTLLLATFAGAQVYSNQTTVTLNMQVSESVTIIPSSQSLPPFTYTNGANASGTQTFSLTSSWQLSTGHTHYDISAWTSSAAAAMTNGISGNIPSSEVYLQANGGTFGPCNRTPDPYVPASINGQTCPVSTGASALALAGGSGSYTDNFTVGLVGLPATGLPVGTYVGVLTFEVGVL
jgi:hypothetical protein